MVASDYGMRTAVLGMAATAVITPRARQGLASKLCSSVVPLPVIDVEPQPAALISPYSPLRVTLDPFSGSYPVTPTSIQLACDTRDVTAASLVKEPIDSPPGTVVVEFVPPQPLSAGLHVAELRFADAQGESHCYRWDFSVADASP